MKSQLYKWIIYYASSIHLLWGAMLLFSASPLLATPIASFDYGNRFVTALLFLGTGILAIVGLRDKPTLRGFVFLLPQLMLLFLTSLSGLSAAIDGHYADGTIKPHLFILAD